MRLPSVLKVAFPSAAKADQIASDARYHQSNVTFLQTFRNPSRISAGGNGVSRCKDKASVAVLAQHGFRSPGRPPHRGGKPSINVSLLSLSPDIFYPPVREMTAFNRLFLRIEETW